MLYIVIISSVSANDISAVYCSQDRDAAYSHAKQVIADLAAFPDDYQPESQVMVISCPDNTPDTDKVVTLTPASDAPASDAPASDAPASDAPARPKRYTPADTFTYEIEYEGLRDDEYFYFTLSVGRGQVVESRYPTAKLTYEKESTTKPDVRTIQRFSVRGYAHGSVGYSVVETGYPFNCPWDSFHAGYIYARDVEAAEYVARMFTATYNGHGLVLHRDEYGDIDEVLFERDMPRDAELVDEDEDHDD